MSALIDAMIAVLSYAVLLYGLAEYLARAML